MICLSFIRVSPAAFTLVKNEPALFDAYLDEDEDDKVRKRLGIKPADSQPLNVEDARLESAIAALRTDDKLSTRTSVVTMSPAAVKQAKLPEVFAVYDIERLFIRAAKRGDYMLVVICPQVEEVREAPSMVPTPKDDRAALLALLASRTRAKLSAEETKRIMRQGLDLAGVALGGEKLKGVLLWNADLSRADLAGTTLVQCDMEAANLEGASLRGATLDMSRFAAARLCGADLTGAKFKDCWIREADLSGVSAQGVKLSTYGGVQFRVKFCAADLRKARLAGSFYDSDFRRANLSDAVIGSSQLLGSDLSGCDLSRANFVEAGLQNANLTGAIIDGARFKGATYTRTTRWPGDPPAGTVLVKK
jgi:uncharacterized protein YjbI with pentapeptide repeats